MAKEKGGLLKGLMKVLFALIALACGIAAVLFMIGAGLSAGKESTIGIYTLVISVFSLAFGGTSVSSYTLNIEGAESTIIEGSVDMQIGVLIAFIVLMVAVFLAVVYVIFAWGDKAAVLKKSFGIASFVCFVAAGILFFCVKPMCPGVTSTEILGQTIDFSDSISLGYGAISTGICSLLGGISIAIASMFSPAKN